MQGIFGPEGIRYLARILAFATAIPVHETAHAYVSDKLGDSTARNLGRLSLNPLKHIDPLGFLAMLLIGIGWAKPVPVNPGYYKNRKKGMALTAAAGPLSNLLLAFLNLVFYKLVYYGGIRYAYSHGAPLASWVTVVSTLLFYLAIINVNLAIFNLLPIPPFDGSRILGLFLPERIYFAIMRYERYIMFGVLAVIFLLPYAGYDPIGWLLGTVGGAVIDFFSWATGFIDKLFFPGL